MIQFACKLTAPPLIMCSTLQVAQKSHLLTSQLYLYSTRFPGLLIRGGRKRWM